VARLVVPGARRLAALACLLAACGPGDAPTGAAKPAAEALPATLGGRAAFVGGERCAACHPTEAAAWRGSHHDLAMGVADESSVLGDFDDAALVDFPTQTRFFRRDGGFFVEAEGADGAPGEFEVKYVFGVDPLQQYLVELPGGRLHPLPVGWDVARQRWFSLLQGERLPPSDPFHWTGRYQSWNAMCAECHSTDLRKNYDAATDSYATDWSEIDVSCEACHGPGAAHVAKAVAAGEAARGEGLVVRFDAEHPRAEIESCAPCHSRRSQAAAEDLHGSPLLDDFAPQTLREGTYHVDGQILEEVYEYGSFLQSRMYAKGVRCSDCHDPHSLKLRAEGNALCARCHSETPDPRFPTLRARRYDASEHHHHAQGSEGARCVACHMPERTYMVVDPRHDHSLRIPRPDLSQRLGTPNACNACHADRDPAWAEAAVARWYGPERRQETHYGEVLAAGRARDPEAGPVLVALARDAMQPAIVRASAVELLPGYGPEALDALTASASDPEELVRLAAARSLDSLPLELRLEPARRALVDPLRAIRIEAARSLGPLASDFLGPEERRALRTALAEYEALQLAAADLGSSHHNLALLAETGGDVDTAELEYRAALRLDPDFQPARMNLATLLNRLERNEEALALLREALARAPEDGEIHYSLGLLLAELGQIEAAEAELGRATELLPRRPRVRYNHALALQRLGRTQQAEAELLAARAAGASERDVLHALVMLYAQSEQWERALPHARALALLSPGEGPRTLLLRVEDEVAKRSAGPPPGSG
jgi:predicted CXXCH cytochrome family protein